MCQSYIRFVSLFIVLLGFSTTLKPDQDLPSNFDDIIAWADKPDIAELIDNTPMVVTRQANKLAVLDILNFIQVPQLLEENFFLRSNNVTSRSLLDYPEFLPFRHDKDKRAVYVSLFFNQTTRANFTRNSSNICSYLATASPALAQKLTNTINLTRELFMDLGIPEPTEILEILDLFRTFTIQERRFGLMIGGKGVLNRWHINAMAPLYYLERNHFVNERTQDDIREITEQLFGPNQDDKKEKEFQDRFFISDKFGIGDTRIYADYPIVKRKYFYSRAGFLMTLPTAFAFQKGLRGTHFKRAIFPPELDLVAIFDLVVDKKFTAATNIVVPFILEAIDNLDAILLDTPLGNGNHFGFGLYLKNQSPITKYFQQDWARRVYWRSFMSLEYLFPHTEQRSFVLPAIIKNFNARNFKASDYPNDQAQIDDNYNFLVQQITDRLFPATLDTTVYPGFIFRSSSQLCYEGDYNGFTIGTDTYVRTKEKFKHISRCPGRQQLIDVCNARGPLVYQSKVVASAFFKVHQSDKLWTLAFIGDYTFMNQGIGADFLLGFNVDVIF